MAADLDGDCVGLASSGAHLVERALSVGVEMRDRAGAPHDRRAAPWATIAVAAAEQARRLDAEIVGDDRDFVGPQAAVAVEEVSHG